MEIALLWFWRFFIYSALGWLMESVLFTIKKKRWINRGFLTGPVCPIYGSGALLLLIVLTPMKFSFPLVFLTGSLLATSLEYLTSWLMETLFHARWWDYSRHRFNLHGRICLANSLAWGALSLALIYGLGPLADDMIGLVPQSWRLAGAAVVLLLFLIDLATSVAGAADLDRQLARLQVLAAAIRRKNGELGENMQQKLAALTRNLRDWRKLSANIKPVQKRLLQAFPDLRSLRYQEALQRLRRWLRRPRKKQLWPSAEMMILRNQLPVLRRKKK